MLKKVLIIINISKDASMILAKEIATELKSYGFICDFFSFDGFCDNTPIQDYDFVITLGGDGTVLYAARNCLNSEIPLFPINLGEFGFIASIEPSEWKNALKKYIEGNASYSYRGMISVEVLRNDKKIYSSYALNDAVVKSHATTSIHLKLFYDNLSLCELKSDGVIISTSTGSTAYSASAGGPIISPELNAIVMTPVNSFSLSSRPIVLNPDKELLLKVEKSRTKEVYLTVDGQEPFPLLLDDIIHIKKTEKQIKLIYCTSENFYSALRSKLNWWGGPHA